MGIWKLNYECNHLQKHQKYKTSRKKLNKICVTFVP